MASIRKGILFHVSKFLEKMIIQLNMFEIILLSELIIHQLQAQWQTVPNYWMVISDKFFGPKHIFINDTHMERLVFHLIQHRNGWLTASDLSHMFIHSIISIYRCLKNAGR